MRLIKALSGLALLLFCLVVLTPTDTAQAQPAENNGAPPANAQGADNAQAGDDGEKEKDTSFLGLLFKGGWFMVPIALCSILGLTLIVERIIALRRGAVIPRTFLPNLERVFQNPDRDAEPALDYCHKNRSPISRVIAVGIRNLPRGIESIEQGIEDAGANEVAKLRRNLRMLYGVAAVAPMLGLLGTVWGLIEAFREAEDKGFGQAQAFAGGIYEALVTTFAGLCVAIPVLVAYYYFLSKIDKLVSDLNEVSESFVERFVPAHAIAPAPTPMPAAAPTPQTPPAAPPAPVQPAAPAPQPALEAGPVVVSS